VEGEHGEGRVLPQPRRAAPGEPPRRFHHVNPAEAPRPGGEQGAPRRLDCHRRADAQLAAGAERQRDGHRLGGGGEKRGDRQLERVGARVCGAEQAQREEIAAGGEERQGQEGGERTRDVVQGVRLSATG
jgi:hypothetical protein